MVGLIAEVVVGWCLSFSSLYPSPPNFYYRTVSLVFLSVIFNWSVLFLFLFTFSQIMILFLFQGTINAMINKWGVGGGTTEAG